MNKSKIAILMAGGINLVTALIHTFLGQSDLVKPLTGSELSQQIITELTSVWHMATIILFVTSFTLLRIGRAMVNKRSYPILELIALLYLLFSLSFIVMSILRGVFAPQWILLLPIAILSYTGVKLNQKNSIYEN